MLKITFPAWALPCLALLVACALCCAEPVNAETLTNESVIALTKAGLGSETIIAKIRNSPNKFDLSTDNLVALKQRNVPDAVIAAMLGASGNPVISASTAGNSDSADPNAQHASGIYLLQTTEIARMQRLDPTTPNQTKTTGILGYAFSYGIANVKMKAVLSNASARVKSSDSHPTFYFYFNNSNVNLSSGAFAAWMPGGVTSPNEFTLERFDVKNGDREVELGRFNITGVKAGVMDKARVPFDYTDVAPGVFKVTPAGNLGPGEYGFVYSSGAGFAGMAGGVRIFDFAIRGDLSERGSPR